MIGISGTREAILRTCELSSKGAFGIRGIKQGPSLPAVLAQGSWGLWELQASDGLETLRCAVIESTRP